MKKLKLTLVLILAGMSFLSFNNNKEIPRIGLNIGDEAPIIQASLINGDQLVSDSLRGKMILINFWASYDAQSRIENHVITDLYSKFKDSHFFNAQGFEVVFISLDRFHAPLNSAIDRDQINAFYHICDFKGISSPLAQMYNISTPQNILLDGTGRIVVNSNKIDKVHASLNFLQRD
ncbi:TlpA family protein disulfide reductase [Marinilabiliaceae bacterium JC017]|nr:TlpA family protein disulfide reductase [Marinilabiliaceae bacterium JC017]